MACSTSRTTPNPSTPIQTAVIPDAKASIITGAIDAISFLSPRNTEPQWTGLGAAVLSLPYPPTGQSQIKFIEFGPEALC
jgi:hypothetical protein